jgi:hypothetical protein
LPAKGPERKKNKIFFPGALFLGENFMGLKKVLAPLGTLAENPDGQSQGLWPFGLK